MPEFTNPVAIALGTSHSCVIDTPDDGLGPSQVKCWGDNSLGQLDVPTLNSPSAIIAAQNYSCAMTNDGIKCWGWQGYGNQRYIP